MYFEDVSVSSNCQIKFKTKMLKSCQCDYSDAYILVKGTIIVENTATVEADANNTNKSNIKVILKVFKNRTIFTDFISEITINNCITPRILKM